MEKYTRERVLACFIIILCVLLASACRDRSRLEPIAEDLQADMSPDAAKRSVDGVTVLVEGGEWLGYPAVHANVTPLKVEIRNRSDVPLRIRYRDIALTGQDGTRFAALPTFEVEEGVEEQTIVADRVLPYQPKIFATEFHYAPYYHTVHSPYLPYPYSYVPSYPHSDLKDHHERWQDLDLPTMLMRDVGTPEGALDPGGTLRGYFFFERVHDDLDHVTFRMSLFSEATGERVGSVDVPLRVTE